METNHEYEFNNCAVEPVLRSEEILQLWNCTERNITYWHHVCIQPTRRRW